MDDPHRQPGDRDRSPLVARIKRAADDGRIGSTDCDIRLANVASAQSITELDLIRRDLDQLEALPVASATGAAAVPGIDPTGRDIAEEVAERAGDAVVSTARSLAPVLGVAAVFVLLGAIASGVLAVRHLDDSPGPEIQLHDPLPTTPAATDQASDPVAPTPAGPAYSLTGPGIRAFLRDYKSRFETSQVLDLTLYADYAIVQVPVVGKARHSGWLFRAGSGFTSFGGVTANFPGAQPVDTDTLAIPALVRNIATARSTLGVEDPTQTYVVIRFFATSDEAPSVDIHVANQFSESGYLATELDGTVEQAYPFTN